MLALCIPLQVLAAEGTEKPISISGALQRNKNTDTTQEEALEKQIKKESFSGDSGGSATTGGEREDLSQNSSNLAADAAARLQQLEAIRAGDQSYLGGDGTPSSANPFGPQVTNSNAVRGFVGGTVDSEVLAFRMSLAKLDNEGFALYGDAESLNNAVQEYGRKYYVACEEGAYYYSPGTWSCSITNRGKTMKKAADGTITHSILYGLFKGESNDYVSRRPSGVYEINLTEDSIDDFMLEMSTIDAYNNALYQEWKNGSSAYPIVAVVEVMGITVNGFRATDSQNRAWVSVADCAYEIGGSSAYEAYLKLDMSTLKQKLNTASKNTDRYAAASDLAIAKVTPMQLWIQNSNRDEHDWWPFFYSKHMFNTWWPNGVVSDSTVPPSDKERLASSWSEWAYQLWQTRSNTQSPIAGCTMFTLTPGYGGQPSGVFDWHIDAEGLPLNASGHAEDKAVDDTGGSTYKQCLVGSVNLYNENWNEWEWYLSEKGVSQVTLDIKVYHTGMDSFSLDYDKVKSRSPGGNVSVYPVDYVSTYSAKDFINLLKSNAESIPLVSRDKLGPKVDDYLSVSYAMTIDVKLDSTGEEIPLTNEDVHWAIYGTDEGRTFKFQQEIGSAYSQIKQGELDIVDYEAMAGTPTTEDLFISMGGEQYVVNMQYRYVEDDYVRTYMMETVPVKNFTYYKMGDKLQTQNYSSSGSGEKASKTKPESNTKYLDDAETKIDLENSSIDVVAYEKYKTAAQNNLSLANTEIRQVLAALVQDTNKDVYGSMYEVCVDAGTVPSEFQEFINNISWDTTGSAAAKNTYNQYLSTAGENPLSLYEFVSVIDSSYTGDAYEAYKTYCDARKLCPIPKETFDKYRAAYNVPAAADYESAEVTLFKGTDPDTGEAFSIKAKLLLTAGKGLMLHSGTHPDYAAWEAERPDASDTHAMAKWNSDSKQEFQYIVTYEWDASFQYTVQLIFEGDAQLSRECTVSPKELQNLVELKQRFNKVKYMDILDCAVWQLKEGAEVGAGAILCSPNDGADKIIEKAVNQLGYVYYDSDQGNTRGWDEATRTWRAIDAGDLEETGRLVNTFNEDEKERLASIPGAYKIKELGDTIFFEYDPSSQGGRSHRSFYKFLAQAAALTFYKSEDTPYTNYIICTSDIMALNTGEPDGGEQRWLPFVGFQFNTEEYAGDESLFQYILSPDSAVSQYFAAGYEIDGKNPNASAGTTWATPIFDEKSLYLGGIVELNNNQAYSECTRESLCLESSVPGAYSFVNNISESGQMPRVGYRGDWNTESEAHTAILLDYGSSFEPGAWFCFGETMEKHRAGVTNIGSDRKITWEDSNSRIATADKEFPYITGLNVVRDTPNNQYAMGEAALFYNRAIYASTGMIDGVLSSIIHTDYSNVKNGKLKEKHRSSNTQGISLQANYDDAWKSINDIVIFNPSSAQYAQVLTLSKYLPDAQNTEGSEATTNPLRDQRTDMTFTDNDYNESVMRPSSDKDETSSVNKSIVSVSYELKDTSDIDTSFYKYPEDYITNEENSTKTTNYDYSKSSETQISTVEEGTYTFSMGGGYDFTTRLDSTDSVYVKRDENAVYLRGRNADLTFNEFVTDIGVQHANNQAYLNRIGYSPDMTEIPMSKGETLGIQVVDDSGVAIPKFLKGEIIHLSFKFASAFNEGSSPFNVYVDGVEVNTNDMNEQANPTAVKTFKWSENGTRLDYYIDMPNDSTSGVVTLVANSNMSIMRSDIPILQFDDILLFRVASDPTQINVEPYNCNTLSYLYQSNASIHVTRNVTCYNNLIVSYVKTSGDILGVVTGSKLRVTVQLNAKSYSLKPEALADPHKVENRNWRYYVMGWSTTSGIVIDSPKHPLLYVESTELYWPGTSETVTVADLMSDACLVKLNDRLYVTTEKLGKEHKIPGATSSVTSWDTFNLFSEIDVMIDVTNNPNLYPLHNIGSTSANVGERYGYEFFFKLDNSDGFLYNVKHATNLVYRWQWKEVEFDENGREKDADWQKDWEIKESKQSELVTTEVANGGIKDFLSLDDGFTIYYPNIGDFAGNGAKDIGNVQNILGHGWESPMDTSTWIYQKWVTFDMDVFMFHPTDPSVKYDPNNLDNLTFYPAGYIIPLGNYTGDSGPDDNDGHWDDYGKDDDGDNSNDYRYHFWVALSNGEQREAETDMATLNINSTGNGANTGNTTPLNKEVPSPPLRYANARKNTFLLL